MLVLLNLYQIQFHKVRLTHPDNALYGPEPEQVPHVLFWLLYENFLRGQPLGFLYLGRKTKEGGHVTRALHKSCKPLR